MMTPSCSLLNQPCNDIFAKLPTDCIGKHKQKHCPAHLKIASAVLNNTSPPERTLFHCIYGAGNDDF